MTSKTLHKLDEAYSEYIRLRDADDLGYINCCTCGKPVFWKSAQNGHYLDRGFMPTRYHDKNNHSQCNSCNCFRDKDDMIDAYEEFLTNRYGKEIIDDLETLKHNTLKISEREAQMLIKHYREKARDLRKLKGL